ncbi:uncharacterized protein LOC134209540 [Armigeres subalbatus]|uniref:uncharacterized protein LOC134209540 n=1 Tax=Armigeres subalbatus TaxID=124917 RepID=UPI002ED379DB
MMDLLKLPRDRRRNTELLTTTEKKRAERILIRRVQMESFPEEWKALSKGSALPLKSPLRWFHPFISKEDGLLRIGGRLNYSEESEERKHPPILPGRHIFTRKLLQSYHEKLLHAGPQLLLASVRLKYWPLGGRNLARQLVHNCLRCYRSKPSTVKQFMGDLPATRVTVSRPFSRTGVDYFGPVYVRPGPRRAAMKAYVALFVCFCRKAIHMELVTDLSTESFLQALRRFISRRGKPSHIFSDNGTNFVGAKNHLTELSNFLRNRETREAITKGCTAEDIQWHFSPPSGPHFGGLWEAGVRSAKKHLLKVLGENVLTFEDMNTLIVQIEGCLNSRPLTQLTEDPEDLVPLTPAHFFIGSSIQDLPDQDFTTIPVNRLRQWHVVQQKLQHFWRRWKRDYLSQMQGRMKRWKPPVEVEIGKLVVIHDDNQPPLRWKMARIHQLHPGDDGVVRVVTLKTGNGFSKRPVEKICLLPLPIQDEKKSPISGWASMFMMDPS